MLLGCLIMVITGHNIVPHHHHSGVLNSQSGCEQAITSEQHDACDHSPAQECKSEDSAEHCHAFNGLEFLVRFEKQIDKKLFTDISSVCLIALIFRDEPLPREVFFGFSAGPPPEFSGFLGESSGLRAPPAIS